MPDLPLSLDLIALKATLILIGAMLAAFALRRASGNSRHTLWTATTVALLALPVLEAQLPRLPLPWLPARDAAGLVASQGAEAPLPAAGEAVLATDQLHRVPPQVAAAVDGSAAPRIGTWLAIAWLLGIAGTVLPVLVGVLRSRRLMTAADDADDPRLRDRLARARALVGVSRSVALRISPAVRTPMTGGVLHPVVLLPESALQWSDDCIDAVLRHELVHVHQRDALRQLASRLSVALYWFHPLAWRAARLGALAREMACDEAVLRLGTRPSRYARHLLELADPLPARSFGPALVRLDHPHLEERVMAILRASPPPASRRLSLSAAALIFGWTTLVASAAPTIRDTAAEEATAAVEFPVEIMPLTADLAAMPDFGASGAGFLTKASAVDCDNLHDSRARSVSGTNGAVRMFTTDHEGTRICVTVRGDNADRDVFIPRGRLPNGVVLTLGTGNSDGERRLEIEGTSRGNDHRWFVDGRARPFDRDAAEWRDAMLSLVGVLIERSEADRGRAVEAMGVARQDMERAVVAMGRSLDAEERALVRPRVAEAVRAPVAANARNREAQLAELRAGRAAEVSVGRLERDAVVAGRAAEVHARRAMAEAQHAEEAAVAGVGGGSRGGVIAPRMAGGRSVEVAELRAREAAEVQLREREVLEAHRNDLEERRVELQRHAEELREHARTLDRDYQRMAEEVRVRAPVVAEGRGEAIVAPRPPEPPRALRAVPAAPATPLLRERESDPRAVEAAERLRAAIRATGET